MQRNRLSRRRVIAGAAGVGAATILHWPANAAEFSYKFGASSPMEHPAMARSQEAANKIKQETNGRMEITIYPNSVLGGDTAMISQAISGALEMYILPVDLLAPRNPVCGILGVGFAFPDYDQVWAAMDGDLGNMLRGVGRADRLLLPGQGLRPRLPPDHHADQADHQPRTTCAASRSACRSRPI